MDKYLYAEWSEEAHLKKDFKKLLVTVFSILLFSDFMFAKDLFDVEAELAKVYATLISENEGLSSFRSLLIPKGGRDESLGQAFTGLCDDLNFMNYNPAASAILKNGQMAFNHNSWIADSKMETLTYASTAGNLGFGGQINCFYLPFSEYNLFGDKVAGSYYSETITTLNVSYNFLAGYNFKGLAVGANFKTGWRGMPDYTDNNTNELILNSGLEQSAVSFMGDLGLMMQFNLLKFYASRDPNVKLGLSVQNLGVAFTGFGKAVKKDDPLPSTANFGFSVKFIKPVTVSFDIKQPFNLLDFSYYEKPSAAMGVELRFTDFVSLMSGVQLKGGNVKFSLGSEFEVRKVRFDVNYTLDLTTSFSPVNRFSASALIQLGDHGRANKQAQVDKWYNEGIYWYSVRNYEMAKACWNEALKIDRHHDPSRTGIETVDRIEEMFKKLREAQFLE